MSEGQERMESKISTLEEEVNRRMAPDVPNHRRVQMEVKDLSATFQNLKLGD